MNPILYKIKCWINGELDEWEIIEKIVLNNLSWNKANPHKPQRETDPEEIAKLIKVENRG